MPTRARRPAARTIATDDFAVEAIYFVRHRRVEAGWSLTTQQPACPTLVWVGGGRATYAVGGQRMNVRAGQLLLVPGNTLRSATTDPHDPWAFDSVGFTARRPDGSEQTFAGQPFCVTPREASDLGPAFRELDEHWHAQSPGSTARCRGIVLRLLGVYLHAAAPGAGVAAHRPAIDAVLDLLSRTHDRWFTVDDLAARARLSPSRFRVVFRRATGMSVVRYQNGVRVRRAGGLLRSGEYTVSEVAALLGFRDVYYFSRLFKKTTGVTPSSQRAL